MILTVFLLSPASVGCLSNSQEDSVIDLIVNYESTNGTIVETYVDGDLQSKSKIILDFDFTKTSSEHDLVSFGIDPNNGRSPVIVSAETSQMVSVEFSEHGIYHLDVFAVDEMESRENLTIVVRIELNIEWNEDTTNEPTPLEIDSIPKNGGPYPSMIIIDSDVENPELIENVGGGREVEITWRLLDEADHACLIRPTTVDEGEIANWKVHHRITNEVHDLTISYDSGQDYIDIDQSISILYEEIESPPNP
ncbi:MAG: hypothetical protein VYC33_01665 [Candidatus Thermoplasmatota archaeon]|nr:hypothetical protein [Candidatus Thermoplasmatota archaeon]